MSIWPIQWTETTSTVNCWRNSPIFRCISKTISYRESGQCAWIQSWTLRNPVSYPSVTCAHILPCESRIPKLVIVKYANTILDEICSSSSYFTHMWLFPCHDCAMIFQKSFIKPHLFLPLNHGHHLVLCSVIQNVGVACTCALQWTNQRSGKLEKTLRRISTKLDRPWIVKAVYSTGRTSSWTTSWKTSGPNPQGSPPGRNHFIN